MFSLFLIILQPTVKELARYGQLLWDVWQMVAIKPSAF
jgi:hypothetical protein